MNDLLQCVYTNISTGWTGFACKFTSPLLEKPLLQWSHVDLLLWTSEWFTAIFIHKYFPWMNRFCMQVYIFFTCMVVWGVYGPTRCHSWPKERGKQVGKKVVSTPKSYCPLGCHTLETPIKSGTRALWGSYPPVTLPQNARPVEERGHKRDSIN